MVGSPCVQRSRYPTAWEGLKSGVAFGLRTLFGKYFQYDYLEPLFPARGVLNKLGRSMILSRKWVGLLAARSSRLNGPQSAATVSTPAALPACMSCMESPTNTASSGE